MPGAFKSSRFLKLKIMAENNKNQPQSKQNPPKVNPSTTRIPEGKKQIVLVKDAYEQFHIGGRVGNPVIVKEELAERMVAAGVAKFQ